MRVLLKLTLDCDPDAAWRALASPTVFREVVRPFLDFTSLEPDGFPTRWPGGQHRMGALALGLVPVGEQLLDLSTWVGARDGSASSSGSRGSTGSGAARGGGTGNGAAHGSTSPASRGQNLDQPTSALPLGVRMVRDTGGGRSGLMRAIRQWDHRMAISAAPDDSGRTLYRDQLLASAGVLDAALWYPTWVFWQWRAARLLELAPTWAYDPELNRAADTTTDADADAGTVDTDATG